MTSIGPGGKVFRVNKSPLSLHPRKISLFIPLQGGTHINALYLILLNEALNIYRANLSLPKRKNRKKLYT